MKKSAVLLFLHPSWLNVKTECFFLSFFCTFCINFKCIYTRWGRGFGILEHIVGEDHILNQSNSLYGIFFFGIQILGKI